MGDRVTVAVVVVILAVVAAAFFYFAPPQQEVVESTESQQAQPDLASQSLEVGNGVGQLAPDFSLEDYEGNVVSLSDFRGSIVFLNFWASWCPFCVNEIPEIVMGAEEAGGGVIVLFVNRGESKEVGQRYLDDEIGVEINHPVVYDVNESVFRQYGVASAMPISYVIDEEGVIRDRKLGPLGKQEFIDKVRAVLAE